MPLDSLSQRVSRWIEEVGRTVAVVGSGTKDESGGSCSSEENPTKKRRVDETSIILGETKDTIFLE